MILQMDQRRFFAGATFLFFLLLFLISPGQSETAELNSSLQPLPVQWYPQPYPYPYPQPYPPGYYPPEPRPYEGTQRVRPSGWINIEIDPQDASVFLDGIKLEPGSDNTYEEGIFTGRHKVEVKKKGFQDYVTWVEIQMGIRQSIKVTLIPIK